MIDRKGLVGDVRLDGEPLRDWEVFSLPLDDTWLGNLEPLRATPARPGVFFRAALQLARPGDCYLDMAGWNKGYLWVNGRLLGRYWHIGPQQRLFCPGVWLREGVNDVLVLDLHRMESAPIGSAMTLSGAH
jgi:beta-galactosidase